jgi:ubiquinone/menaquinone biosynthesis C-methylase UbiE
LTKQREVKTEYHVNDAHELAFPDATFDGCRAERILQHCHTPELVLREMIRVVKPGGVVVVIDVDHDTFVTNLINHELARKFTKANCDQIRNGWIGRRLSGLFHSYGLTDISVIPTAICKTKCDLEDMQGMLDGALSDNLLTQEEVNELMCEIQNMDRHGQYCEAGIIFTVVGHKSTEKITLD